MNNADIKICVQVFVEKYGFFNLGYMLGVEFLGYTVTPNCCKKWMHHSTSIPAMSEGFSFSKSLSILAVTRLLNFCQSRGVNYGLNWIP